MATCNLSLQVVPLVDEKSLYSLVDQIIGMISVSGVKYKVGPMETTMEGELDLLLQIVKKAQNICTEAGADRVLSIIKIDYSPGGVTIDEKITKYKK
jgi:uncharacterized protein (TIGR00106 family)